MAYSVTAAAKNVQEDGIDGVPVGLTDENGARLAVSGGLFTATGVTALATALASGGLQVNAIGVVTTAATLKDLNLNTLTLTHAQACTLTMPSPVASHWLYLIAHQDTVSSFNGTIVHTGVKIAGGSLPTMTASTGAIDLYEYYSDGTIWIMRNKQQAIA